MTLKKREASVSFFKLTPGDNGGVDEFKGYVRDVYSKLEAKNYDDIEDVKIGEDVYYIESIQKRSLDEKINGSNTFYYLICLSRIELNNDVEIGDASIKIRERRRRKAETKDTEGLIVERRIVFDPYREIITTYNQRGSINNQDLRRFISKSVDIRGISLEIILNKEGYDRLVNLDETTVIKYTVASPNKFQAFKDDNRSEHKDLEYAQYFSAEKVKVELEAAQLNNRSVLSKVKSLMKPKNKDENVSTLIVEGYKDGEFDKIDLIKNKLIYKGNIYYDEQLDDHAIFGFLNEAYDNFSEYLHEIYKTY